MRRLLVFVTALVLALGLAAPAVRVANAADDVSWELLGLINDYRASMGLGALTMNDQLGAAAQFHSEDMAANNYFSHGLADGSTWHDNLLAHGYDGSPTGENIAAGMDNAADTLVAWQNSPGHDEMLRNPNFTEVGIGRAYGDGTQYGWYWTADFGGGSGLVDAAPADGTSYQNPSDGTVTTTVDDNGMVTTSTTEPGTITQGQQARKQQDSSNGGNSTADAAPPPIVLGDLNLTGQNTTIVAPTSSTTVDSSGENSVSPPPPSNTGDGGGNNTPNPPGGPGQSGVATATGNDGTITYNASDDGNGNQIVTTSGDAQAPSEQVARCNDYATWYDAQTAYEAQGGTDGDPAVVNSLDPDWDGIACEGMMD